MRRTWKSASLTDDPLEFCSCAGCPTGDSKATKQGYVAVRQALCEAAASVLLRVRKWSALRAWGLRNAKRSSMLCAIVAEARQLAGICTGCGSAKTDFQVGLRD